MTEEYKPVHADETDICIIAHDIVVDIRQYVNNKYGYKIHSGVLRLSSEFGATIEIDMGQIFVSNTMNRNRQYCEYIQRQKALKRLEAYSSKTSPT